MIDKIKVQAEGQILKSNLHNKDEIMKLLKPINLPKMS